MSKIKLRDRINALVRDREESGRKEFLEADSDVQLYMLHKDFSRIAKEIKLTRIWIFFVMLFTFAAVSQIANFFVR